MAYTPFGFQDAPSDLLPSESESAKAWLTRLQEYAAANPSANHFTTAAALHEALEDAYEQAVADADGLPAGGPGVLVRDDENGPAAWAAVEVIDASGVPVSPPVNGQETVQDALADLDSRVTEGGGTVVSIDGAAQGSLDLQDDAAEIRAALGVDTPSDPRTPATHSHAQSDVTGLAGALAGKADVDDPRLGDARAPTAHSHAQSDVTGLASALAAKSDTGHSHAQSDVTGLGTALAGKVDTGDARLTDARPPTGTAGGVLSGTYPNPAFAADMATQAELEAVAADKADADDLVAHAAADEAVHGIPATGALVVTIKFVSGQWKFDGATVAARPALPPGAIAIWSGGMLVNDPSALMAVHDIWAPHEAP